MGHIKKGDRIELITTTDKHTDLKPGTRGTVVGFQDYGGTEIIDVHWDTGSRLGMIPTEGDKIRLVRV